MGRKKGSKNTKGSNSERANSFFVTLNTPTPEEIAIIENLKKSVIGDNIKYCKWAVEEGEQEQREHVHIYLHFKSAERWAAVKKILQRADIHPPIGTPQQQIDYIGNPDYCYSENHSDKKLAGKPKGGTCTRIEEWGSTEGIRLDRKCTITIDDRLNVLKRLIDEGATPSDLYDEDFPAMVRYGKGIAEYFSLQEHHKTHQKQLDRLIVLTEERQADQERVLRETYLQ